MRFSSIGAGNMASAIIKSAVASKRAESCNITVYDINKEKYLSFQKIGVNCVDMLEQACFASDIILLAVKPQDYESVLLQIKPFVSGKNKIFITIAAAISTQFICKMLGEDFPVVRVMPNTPLLIGYGATAISRNKFVDDKLYTKICGLFASSGHVVSLDESMMNTVISVNSSSPAYIYLLAKAMISGAVLQGIDASLAKDLVYKTIKGSAEMLLTSEMSADELIKMVASPKGTTEAALNSFEQAGFCKIVADAMNACTDRANELAR